jgi:hypothetical protein
MVKHRLSAPPSPATDGEVSVTEAAYRLGCSIGVRWQIGSWSCGITRVT